MRESKKLFSAVIASVIMIVGMIGTFVAPCAAVLAVAMPCAVVVAAPIDAFAASSSIESHADATVSSIESQVEVTAENAYDLVYDDQAGLIWNPKEKEELRAQMGKMTDEMHVIFYTTEEYSSKSIDEQCEEYVAERYGWSKRDPAVMFAIDMYHRQIYLYCTGPVRYVISDSDALTITDNVYRMATKGDYAGCAKEAFAEAHALAEGYAIKRPMKVINNVLIALFLGFLGNYLVLKIARSVYRRKFTYRRNAVRGAVKIHTKTSKKHVRTYHYTEDSGGGSSGGGGFSGGGGGFSGGGSSGGGHSF